LSTGTRPIPMPDEQSASFWVAAADHTLVLARCSRCGAFSHPPDVVCLNCGSTDPAFAFTPVEGAGAVRSWTVMRQSFLPGFDVPFVLVDVEMDVQPELRLIGRLIGGTSDSLRVGAAVSILFEEIGPGVSVPAFTLATEP
jgi:uncharacterized OB-fold protein